MSAASACKPWPGLRFHQCSLTALRSSSLTHTSTTTEFKDVRQDRKQLYAMTTADPELDVMSAAVTGGFWSSVGSRQARLSPWQPLSLGERRLCPDGPAVWPLRPCACCLPSEFGTRTNMGLWLVGQGLRLELTWQKGVGTPPPAHGSRWVCQKMAGEKSRPTDRRVINSLLHCMWEYRTRSVCTLNWCVILLIIYVLKWT